VPVYQRFSSAGYGVRCVGNMRAIGTAFFTYQAQYSGWMPYVLIDEGEQKKGVTYAQAIASAPSVDGETGKPALAVGWKYELSFILGNYSLARRVEEDFCLSGVFFDPVKGRGKGNYFLSSRHFGARLQVKVPAASGGWKWEHYYEFINIDAERTGGIQGRVAQEIQPKGYMPYGTWREPSRAAIMAPSKSPLLQRGLGRDGDDVNIEYRHNGEANILFLDGHVSQYKKGDDTLFELFDEKFDPKLREGLIQMESGQRLRQLEVDMED
jgi:prepilin-type processing-associated H-X9-DG protein